MVGELEVAYRTESCSKRQDVCACMQEVTGVLWIPRAITILLWAYLSVCVLEVRGAAEFLLRPYTSLGFIMP